MEPFNRSQFCFGPFVVDPIDKLLLREGTPVHLGPKAFETLVALLEKQGRLVGKAELLNRVWPDAFVEEATLAQNIFTLRKALGEGTNGDTYIETVPKRGYRFVAPVTNLEQPEARLKRESQARRIFHWGALGVLVVATSAGFYFWTHSRAVESAPSPSRITLAVLPFQNLTPDPQQEYLSDGLTEEMITQLGGLNPQRLGVIARTSAMHYKASTETAGQIGRELGVDYLVEGSLRRDGSRVRITAQLIRARDQMHLWAQDYNRDFNDYLAVESEVARDIAGQIQLKLRAQGSSNGSRTTNASAYEDYLRGRFFWNKRSEEGHLKAIEYFDRATAADPNYAQAYSGLADAYALLGSNANRVVKRSEAMDKARAAALKALAIDETLAEAHTSLAFVYWHYDWDWPAAEKEFQRALQLNPSYATAHQWFAFYLLSQHRMNESLEEIRTAQRMDPLSLIINTDMAQILFFSRRYDEAREHAKKVLEMDARFSLAREVLAWCMLAQNQNKAALAEAKQAFDASADPDEEIVLAITCAAAGDKQTARTILARLARKPTDPFSVGFAQAYAALGEKDQAFGALQNALQSRNGGLTLLRVLPFLDSLRDDPRFTDLAHRIGLP
jgi:TolB-like protein/DNA-binding winged helix-turn-helix (wHTH) protein/Tfp pilus assembly protein PilF